MTTDTPARQPLEGLPVCPECGSATFWNNTDGCQTIFCINDDCKWKQQIRSRPHTSPPAPDDIDLEELGNEDIDPKAFEIYARTCDEGAKEQYFRELAEKQRQEMHDAQVAKAAREQVLLEYAAWDDTRYTTQRINEFREQTTTTSSKE